MHQQHLRLHLSASSIKLPSLLLHGIFSFTAFRILYGWASTVKDNVDKDLELEASGFRKCFPGQNWNQQQQQQQPSRTCTKVHKHGAMGRALDLSKFRRYTQLLEELQHLFGTDENLNVRVARRKSAKMICSIKQLKQAKCKTTV
ncbi:hypothetical protein SELMODRAFT_404004 [Selaginella moellendorffii]|uniref:Uncharacterized protein n=1 Tax=Selaginella moellendorffii TaxID=88036 RepID=D8QT97_SELML|nr:hypothetical protein SELMODRAFT_404004 [Selaginella moellendorffii]